MLLASLQELPMVDVEGLADGSGCDVIELVVCRRVASCCSSQVDHE